jgi:hypothetical protein
VLKVAALACIREILLIGPFQPKPSDHGVRIAGYRGTDNSASLPSQLMYGATYIQGSVSSMIPYLLKVRTKRPGHNLSGLEFVSKS